MAFNIDNEEFARKLNEIDDPITNYQSSNTNSDLNNLIINYLATEGYASTAAKFAEEAQLKTPVAFKSIKARFSIRDCILSGNIVGAIERITDLEPELLEKQPSLHFTLLRLQLIELIKKANEDDKYLKQALDFASEVLAPRIPEDNPSNSFLQSLEYTISLLCFPKDTLESIPELKKLLHPSLRLEVASQVNKAIIEYQGINPRSKIWDIIEIYHWSQQELKDLFEFEFPDIGADLAVPNILSSS
ncbi:hypothetical protein CANCADRAFT_44860 [Tortispora caseinolytica NRRL Y-17796]|uniref:CTLH domain-containing protein n=1 Tax=Tortispora caseinolytica NRRL Y-17796 TaxID=767744 RepID=A0A1E4THM7_9ASCO|nr:hypothetical protein CANCADRAFT_44860 [Tortispora caseinolytica NRRL Y-17796]